MNRISFVVSKLLLFSLLLLGCSLSMEAQKNVSTEKFLQENNLFFDAEKAKLLKDFTKAMDLYKKVIDLNPKNDAAYFNLAKINFEQSSLKDARKYIEEAIDVDRSNKTYINLYAEILMYLGENSKAIEQLKVLTKIDPLNDAEYLFKTAKIYTQEKKYSQAIDMYNQLEQKSYYKEQALLEKLALLSELGDVEKYEKEVQKLISENPNEAKYYIHELKFYEKHKLADKAEALYKLLESKFSSNSRVQILLAQYYLNKKDKAKSNLYLDQAIDNPGLPVETKLNMLLPLLANIKSDSVARQNLLVKVEKIYLANPADPAAQSIYADLLLDARQYSKAEPMYKKALKTDPNNYDNWQKIFALYNQSSQYDSMVLYTQKALDYFPNNANIYLMNALGYFQQKNFSKAQKSIQRGMDFSDENTTTAFLSLLADVFNSTKQFKSSDSCFDLVLKADPNDASTLNNYAYYLSVRNERLDEALLMSQKSLTIRPNEKTFLDTYAWILYKQKKYNEARDTMLKCIAQEGDTDATMFEHLGDIYFRLNDNNKALDYWKKAKQSGEGSEFLLKKIAEQKLYE